MATPEPTAPAAALTLTALDRCDRCGAQAYVRTLLADLELLWCGHHWDEFGAPVVAKGAVVTHDDLGELRATAEG